MGFWKRLELLFFLIMRRDTGFFLAKWKIKSFDSHQPLNHTLPARRVKKVDQPRGISPPGPPPRTGREADIAVLKIIDEPATLRDSVGGEWSVNQRIAAQWTIRQGELLKGKG